jgi:uridylate kinase
MKRVLIKLSGEMLSRPEKGGIDPEKALDTARRLLKIQGLGLQVAVVIGGGNMLRGADLALAGLGRSEADQMGMLATLMNGIVLKDAIRKVGGQVHLFSALDCPKVADNFSKDRAVQALERKELVIFVGGTGNPFFTTDTAAALRASEIEADLLAKATKVDGVYDKDPRKGGATKYDKISWDFFIQNKLEVMDQTAVQLCKNQNIPIFVFNMSLLGEVPLDKIISGKQGTLISE